MGPIREKHTSNERFVGVQLDEKITTYGGVFGSRQVNGIFFRTKLTKKLKKIQNKFKKIKTKTLKYFVIFHIFFFENTEVFQK